MQRRAWGFWSVHKLDVLGDYFHAFNVASKRAGPTGTRGDTAFHEALPLRPSGGCPRAGIVAALGLPGPRLPSRPGRQQHAAVDRARRHPRCRSRLGTDVRVPRPRQLGIQWSTLEALADFKRDRRYKVELWILCFSSAMPRVLTVREDPDAAGSQQLTNFFGTEQWRATHRARAAGDIDAAQAREEYVNLLRWRLQHVLGYKHTLAFDVRNVRGTLYHLVFTTDHDAGFTIMRDLMHGQHATTSP